MSNKLFCRFWTPKNHHHHHQHYLVPSVGVVVSHDTEKEDYMIHQHISTSTDAHLFMLQKLIDLFSPVR